MEGSIRTKRARDSPLESEIDADSPEIKRLKEDLLDSLDDDDNSADLCPASDQDLDSFMKSFEEEIAAASSAAGATTDVDLRSDCGGSRPDLGFLLEASDDELGLPPTGSGQEELRFELDRFGSDSSGLGEEFWEIPSYDSFELGLWDVGGSGNEYVALDGLFDYSDLGFFARRPETMPAQ